MVTRWLLVSIKYSQALALNKSSGLHRMKLSSHNHSSKFMEWHNLDIAIVNTAICVSLRIVGKPNNYQFYLPNFLKFCVNISHKLWKFLNDPLCRNILGHSPYSVLPQIGRVATPTLAPSNCH